MDSTEVTIRRFLTALPSPGYDLGILNDQGMYRLEGVLPVRVLRMLPYLKYRNAHNAHIYLRPTGESAYTLLDDLTEPTIETLTKTGYGPAAVIETSPGNFQAWLRHPQPLCKELGTSTGMEPCCTLAALLARTRAEASLRADTARPPKVRVQ